MARGRHRPGRRRHRREHGTLSAQLAARVELFVRGTLAALLLVALVAGLPWGLCRYVGWPLPDHLPAGREAAASLTAPLNASLLLKVLACVLWATWLAFLGGVLRTAVEGLRRATGGHRPAVAGGPLTVLAAALLGAAALALLPGRVPQASLAAPKRQITADAPSTSLRLPRAEQDGSNPAAPWEKDTTALVRPPLNGVHDSLWRIADRHLDDGGRWPEIYALNYGRRQADGHALIDPGLIRPGWVLRLPAPRPDPGDDPGRGHPPVPPSRPAPPSGGTETPTSPSTPSSAAPQPPGGSGLDLPEGVFIGAGTAAVIAAALLFARRRRRVRYRPGSGAREDLRLAPVIRALRRASAQPAGSEGRPARTPQAAAAATGAGAGRPGRDAVGCGRARRAAQATTRVLGVKDGQDLAWDLARSRGLGLTGPGALDATRALLLSLMAERPGEGAAEVELLMGAGEAQRLLGRRTAGAAGRRLRIVADLPQALQLMETEILSRTRARSEDATAAGPARVTPQIVLIAVVPAEEERRVQAILDSGAALGMAGILIGQWRPGGTLRVRDDGTVGAASPAHAQAFAGARLFTVPPEPAAAILDLLLEAAAEESATHPFGQDPRASPSVPPPRAADSRQPPAPPGAGEQRAAGAAEDRAPALRGDANPVRRSGDGDRLIRICVLGRVTVTYRAPGGAQPADVTGMMPPKQRELLAHLALQREGARREKLTAAIWPDAPYTRPFNAFHATLSQLRRVLRTTTHGVITGITWRDDTRYGLDERQVSVDLWELKDALRAARTQEGEGGRQAALRQVVDRYAGDFADDVAGEWAEAPRENLRREYLDAVSALVRVLRGTDPDRALDLLEQARERDRYNEAIYRDIARVQAQLEEYDAIPRTLELLKRALAELDQLPGAATLTHFEMLEAGGRPDNRTPEPGN
ncbi:hypothetical protein [Streptomyces sp. NPDC055189]